MKRVVLFATMFLLSASSIAATTATSEPSKEVKALGSAWKTHRTLHPKQDSELAMVYGGEDVSTRAVLDTRTEVAA